MSNNTNNTKNIEAQSLERQNKLLKKYIVIKERFNKKSNELGQLKKEVAQLKVELEGLAKEVKGLLK